MKKHKKYSIALCAYYKKEASEIIKNSGISDVDIITFAPKCDRGRFDWKELETLFKKTGTGSHVHIIGSCCISGIEVPDSLKSRYSLHEIKNCLHLLLNNNLVDSYVAKGSYIMSPGWLVQWRSIMKMWGFSESGLNCFFHDTVNRLTLLDTGVYPDITKYLDDFSQHVKLPVQTIPAGLDYMELFLKNILSSNHRDGTKENPGREFEFSRKVHADYAMSVDLFFDLTEKKSEPELVSSIYEFFHMLFAPARSLYISHRDGTEKIERSSGMDEGMSLEYFGLAFHENFKITGHGDGLYVKIINNGEILGMIFLEELKFPDYMNHYLNLVLQIAPVCALSIRNMRKTDEILQARHSLAESEKKFRTLATLSPAGIFLTDAAGKFLYVNPGWEKITGLSLEEMQAPDWISLIDPDDREKFRDSFISHLTDGKEWSMNFRMINKDGIRKWVLGLTTSLLSDDKNFDGYVGILFDITEIKKNEIKLKEALTEKEFLMKEIHHRVKNNLQLVSSMLSLQEIISEKGEIKAFTEAKNRIRSIASVHELLYKSDSLGKIDLMGYLSNIIENLEVSLGIGFKVSIKFETPEISLGIRQAVPLGIIINELVTNSMKYAFPAGFADPGISLVFRQMDEIIEISISDNGIGLPEGFNIEKSETLGLRLVHMLLKQLKGNIRINRGNGTQFIIDFMKKLQ